MDPQIIAGPQSNFISTDETRFISSDNMVSHGGLSDISVQNQDPVYKLFIGMYDFITHMLKIFKMPLEKTVTS